MHVCVCVCVCVCFMSRHAHAYESKGQRELCDANSVMSLVTFDHGASSLPRDHGASQRVRNAFIMTVTFKRQAVILPMVLPAGRLSLGTTSMPLGQVTIR